MKTSHIEHIKPQSKFKNNALDYDNLLCSCGQNPEPKKKRRFPVICGEAKGKWYEENLFVSPLDDSCEKRIKIKTNGKLTADSGDEAATITIQKLNLNCKYLVDSRKKVLDIFLGLDKVKIASRLQGNKGFHPYHTAIAQFYGVELSP